MAWAQLHHGPDLLADLLREVHSSRRAFARAELRGRWSMHLRGVGSAHFHAVEQGSCWVLVPDEAPIELEAGDVALLPSGGGHRLASHRSGRGRPFEIPDPREDSPSAAMVLHHDGPGELTQLVCGALGRVPGGADAALATLPTILVARRQDPRNRWLLPTLHLLFEEAGRAEPGARLVVERLSDTLFVQFVRDWILHGDHQGKGVLAGLRDGHVAQALAMMHREPAQPWTVDALARRVGLSRSRLAARFRELVGTSPHAYLVELRLRRAVALLSGPSVPIGQVATEVGYRSAAAFSKAFSRRFGVPPGRYSTGISR